jgi:hypothetical protein
VNTYDYNESTGAYTYATRSDRNSSGVDPSNNVSYVYLSVDSGSVSGMVPIIIHGLTINRDFFLPIGTTGVPYSSPQLTASGGTPPYQWAGFNLPNGLNVVQVGDIAMISGSPLTPSGTFPAPNNLDIPIGSYGTIRVADSMGNSDVDTIGITVVGRPRYINLTDSDKLSFLGKAVAETIYIGALGYFGYQTGCFAVKLCFDVISTQIAGVGQLAYYDYANAADPPDPNYTQVVQPIYDAVKPVTTGQGFTVAAANALNNLSQNQSSQKGLTLAIAVSLNRLQGAQQANDNNWATLQSQAAKWYALQLTSYLGAESNLRAIVGSQMQDVLPNLQITSDQLTQLQVQVASNGFSTDELSVLSGAGLLSSEINILAKVFGENQVNYGSGTLDSLLSGQTINSLTQQALTSYAHFGADRNNDLQVTCADVALVKAAFGKRLGQSGYDPMADVNIDGVVDIRDVALVSRQLPANTRCQ